MPSLLQRACELCIDLANHKIRKNKIGLPTSSAESFALLAQANIIDANMANNMKRMVGFRNILVHQYIRLDIQVMVKVIEEYLDELLDFARKIE